ncbi:Transglutaminase-like superfamily protein [Amycolatopsis xylanica]|uniref:Transglutaminase-like superfamily protein n=1 Tax=Amycolatopsis xylanica TaxID=589385 RepID=A0A1H3SEF2_9PSEU|nr:lasso peptide biosynthesis B2 protein [Amycolatopsis xylanica]SDZ36372.1 Transglutaminase-like superfamily protein [Amycolatopsis xylanica]
MTIPVLPSTPTKVFARDRVIAGAVVGVARVLAKQKPREIRAVLAKLRGGVPAATLDQAREARNTVLAVSPRCCGSQACLTRSIAAVLLCRVRGVWPTWCVGVLAAPPFTAHAWIEADGEMVDEVLDGSCYRRMIAIAPSA